MGQDGILPDTRRGRWFVAAVLGLALVLRVGTVVAIRHRYFPLTDAAHFDAIATSMAHGHGYGNFPIPPAEGTGAFRSPLYPFALSLVYIVAGDHSWTAGLLQNALLGTALVAMVGVLAALLWSRRVGAIALALAAVHPTLILVGTSLQLEPLLVTLSLGAVAAAVQHRRSDGGVRWAILAGVLAGLAILTRELGFALIPAIAWLVFSGERSRRPGRRALALPVVAVLVAAAVVVPWTIRNAVRYHALVPVSSSSGFGLAGTYNATAMAQRGVWVPPYEDPHLLDVMLALDHPDEEEVDKALRAEAIDFAVDHPGYVPQVAFFGLVRLFDLDGGSFDRSNSTFLPYPPLVVWASVLATYPVLLLAIVGARSRLARQVPLVIWLTPVLIVVAIAFLLPANVRYRSSIEPYLLLLASLALLPLVDRWADRRQVESEGAGQETDRPS